MAVTYVLALNAGPDRAAAGQLAQQLADVSPLPAGRHRVALLPPVIRVIVGDDGVEYQEVSVTANGLGVWFPDPDWQQVELDEDELDELTRGMYELLRRCRGYRAAIVGWNAEHVVDLGELAESWTEELAAGGSGVPGLVLSDEALAQVRVSATVEPFAPGFSWMPYRG